MTMSQLQFLRASSLISYGVTYTSPVRAMPANQARKTLEERDSCRESIRGELVCKKPCYCCSHLNSSHMTLTYNFPGAEADCGSGVVSPTPIRGSGSASCFLGSSRSVRYGKVSSCMDSGLCTYALLKNAVPEKWKQGRSIIFLTC